MQDGALSFFRPGDRIKQVQALHCLVINGSIFGSDNDAHARYPGVRKQSDGCSAQNRLTV
jgi:hypothetical protein